MVLVRDYDHQEWDEYMYISMTTLGAYPYIVMDETGVNPIIFRQMKRIEKTVKVELTEEEANIIDAALNHLTEDRCRPQSQYAKFDKLRASILAKLNGGS